MSGRRSLRREGPAEGPLAIGVTAARRAAPALLAAAGVAAMVQAEWPPLAAGLVVGLSVAILSLRLPVTAVARDPAHALRRAIADHPSRAGQRAAVLTLDVMGFHEVRELAGPRAAEQLVAEASARLAPLGRSVRVGVNRFAVATWTDLEPAELASHALRSLEAPLHIDGLDLEIEAAAGVAVDLSSGGVRELVSRSEAALEHARAAVLPWAAWAPGTRPPGSRRARLGSDLATGLRRGEVEVHFQPKVSLTTGRVHGAEALARWYRPGEGWVGPDEFIAVAERSRLITRVTEEVLDQSLRAARGWHAAGHRLEVAVNLSAALLVDESITASVGAALRRHGLEPSALKLEITETAIMSDPERARAILAELYRLGVRLSIDDYGAGQTSLAQLTDLPISELKIDRAFIDRLPHDRAATAIVGSTIELALDLGLDVVAEGVERTDQWDLLADLGCPLAQGFLVSPALEDSAFERWVDGNLCGERELPEAGRAR